MSLLLGFYMVSSAAAAAAPAMAAVAAYTEMTACRICQSGMEQMETVMDLGEQVIASQFPEAHQATPPSIPLVLVRCRECGLVQLKHSAIPDELYAKTYGYRSGLNDTMRNHLKGIVEEAWATIGGQIDPLSEVIVDIGSNDATLLKAYDTVLPVASRRVGIDPTGTQFKEHYPADIELVPDYFTEAAVEKSGIRPGSVKIITSIAMFYDLPDPVGFAKIIATLLAPEGIWIMEQSYMPTMIERRSFDTICHEHLEYYTIQDIKNIASRSGLRIVRVSFNDCNGGSFRVILCKAGGAADAAGAEHSEQEKGAERAEDLEHVAAEPEIDFKAFQMECDHQRDLLNRFLADMVAQGKSIYLYGASTKGNTLLQYYGINHTLIRGAAERNPTKYGCRTPKTDIPILPEADVRAARPDFMLVLPWHFKQEFLEREKSYLSDGGQFIFPLPYVSVVGGPKRPRAIITGASGQIAHYMTEKLLNEGYTVYGISRDAKKILPSTRHVFYLTASAETQQTVVYWADVFRMIEPTVIYDFAAESVGFQSPQSDFLMEMLATNQTRVVALMTALAAWRKDVPVFLSSSVEIWRKEERYHSYSDSATDPLPPPCPANPYGIAKSAVYWIAQYYRSKGIPVFQGIFSNVESCFRKESFVLQKISRWAGAAVAAGSAAVADSSPLTLGNLNVFRDWIHAEDAVEAVFLLMHQATPGDYLVASGKIHCLKKVAEQLLNRFGISLNDPNIHIDTQSHPDPDYSPRVYIPHTLQSLDWTPRYTIDTLLDDLAGKNKK
jgi:NDP-4-keto-2,6-dideoxyhexose 3-C-methyltransferase